MGIEKTHGRNYDLVRLLAAIDLGEIVLPEFQRDFVWDTTAVKQLIATCLTGWPIGSLLLLPGSSRIFFRVREFESAPRQRSALQLVVLDGQQRLTSLYQALYGRGDFLYGVKFDLLRNDQSIEELEEAIISLPADKWRRAHPNPKSEYLAGVVPVSALRRATDFYEWRDSALEGGLPEQRSQLTDLYVNLLSGLDRYEVPAVVIDDDVHPEAIARIFERVNRLGQPLGTFDLMVAKSYAEDFNLRDEWEKIQLELPQLGDFLKGDGLPILSVIALHVRESVRQHDVLQLSGGSVRDYWRRAAVALNNAVEYLQNELHVWKSDWLPYRIQLTVLGCLAMNLDLEENRGIINGWFWGSVFQGRYDVASNTRAVEDYGHLSKGKAAVTGEIALDRETMFTVNKRQYGALHRGLLCLYASHEPIDPFATSGTSPKSLLTRDDDLITVSFLSDEITEWGVRGHLLTLGMLLATKRSGRSDSTVTLTSLPNQVLASQVLPTRAWQHSIDETFSGRLNLIVEAISKVSGIPTRVTDDENELV